MHQRYVQTMTQVTAWAEENESIQGVIVIGSQARSFFPADPWSDLDLMVLADDPSRFTGDNVWFQRFGSVVCFFDEIVALHFTTWNWHVKRVLFQDGRDVDFSILPYDHLDEVLVVNQDILSKGYRIEYDAGNGLLETKIRALLQARQPDLPQPLSPQELDGLVNDLLFHVIWAQKKILRGELWVALGCINSYMRERLFRLIEAYQISTGQQHDPLHYDGRFLEQRAGPELLDRLRGCFTRYDADEATCALQNLLDLTRSLTREICQQSGAAFDESRFAQVQAMYNEMQWK